MISQKESVIYPTQGELISILQNAAVEAENLGSKVLFDITVKKAGEKWHTSICDLASSSKIEVIKIMYAEGNDQTLMCHCMADSMDNLFGESTISKSKLTFAIAVSLRDDDRHLKGIADVITRINYLHSSFYSMYDSSISLVLGIPQKIIINEIALPLSEYRSTLIEKMKTKAYQVEIQSSILRYCGMIKSYIYEYDLYDEVGFRVQSVNSVKRNHNFAADNFLIIGPNNDVSRLFTHTDLLIIKYIVETNQKIWQSQWNGETLQQYIRGPYWLYLLSTVGNYISPPLLLSNPVSCVAGQLWSESGKNSPYQDMRLALNAANIILKTEN
jgi:hypothetical protein